MLFSFLMLLTVKLLQNKVSHLKINGTEKCYFISTSFRMIHNLTYADFNKLRFQLLCWTLCYHRTHTMQWKTRLHTSEHTREGSSEHKYLELLDCSHGTGEQFRRFCVRLKVTVVMTCWLLGSNLQLFDHMSSCLTTRTRLPSNGKNVNVCMCVCVCSILCWYLDCGYFYQYH